jgi:hypothetical protein
MFILIHTLYNDALGAFCRMSSISFMISSVNLGSSASALQLSWICSGFDAPRMTVLTFGLCSY